MSVVALDTHRRPMKVGTCYAGRVVHRAEAGQYRWRSKCGVVLSRVHDTEDIHTAGAHWSLCSKCFTSDERWTVRMRHMEDS